MLGYICVKLKINENMFIVALTPKMKASGVNDSSIFITDAQISNTERHWLFKIFP